MTLSTRIAPHLPYLRRFSRALTGSQASGDAYVAAALEALIADVSIFPDASSDRIGLYRLFCDLYKIFRISRHCRDRRSCLWRLKAFPTRKPPKFSNWTTPS